MSWTKTPPSEDGYYWLWPKGLRPEVVFVETRLDDEQKFIVWDIGNFNPHKLHKESQYLWNAIAEPTWTYEEWVKNWTVPNS